MIIFMIIYLAPFQVDALRCGEHDAAVAVPDGMSMTAPPPRKKKRERRKVTYV
jgi:hypothetical protein